MFVRNSWCSFRLYLFSFLLLAISMGVGAESNSLEASGESEREKYYQSLLTTAITDPEVRDKLKSSRTLIEWGAVFETYTAPRMREYDIAYGTSPKYKARTIQNIFDGVTTADALESAFFIFQSAVFNEGPAEAEEIAGVFFVPLQKNCYWLLRPASIMLYQYKGAYNYMFTDLRGRPFASMVFYSGKWPKTAPRQENCQLAVGAGTASKPGWSGVPYQGGHLVPSRLNGFGGRANLVPQDGDLNTKEWNNIVEATAAICINKISNERRDSIYWALVEYPNGFTIIPDTFDAGVVVERAGFTMRQDLGGVENNYPVSKSDKNKMLFYQEVIRANCK